MPVGEDGRKYDDGKVMLDLIDPEYTLELGKVLTFGAKKYDPHNWRKGLRVSRLIAGAKRHLNAVERGEDRDPETGLSHLAHAGCCLMFLYWTLEHRKDMDDRYKEGGQ